MVFKHDKEEEFWHFIGEMLPGRVSWNGKTY